MIPYMAESTLQNALNVALSLTVTSKIIVVDAVKLFAGDLFCHVEIKISAIALDRCGIIYSAAA